MTYISKKQLRTIFSKFGISVFKTDQIFRSIRSQWRDYLSKNKLIDPGIFSIPESLVKEYAGKIGIDPVSFEKAESEASMLPIPGMILPPQKEEMDHGKAR
jgi:hypothetical protein